MSQRVFDVIVASAALAACAMPMLFITMVIRLSSRGPILFKQSRVGLQGNLFECLKFRSMSPGAEEQLLAILASDAKALEHFRGAYKLVDDPRVTRVGRWLRRTSLDELPQLFNVLRGEMSIVGPRPIVPEEIWRYGDHALLALQTRPGMTGLWQVSGRSNISYPERVRLDTEYVLTRSLVKDVRIVCATVREMRADDGRAC